MDVFFYFLVIGVVIVVMILQFDKQQRRRVSKLSKEVSDVQPLFLLKSAGHKLESLKTMLYGNLTANGLSGRINMNEAARQYIASQLDEVINSYKCGQVSLNDYQQKLNGLQKMVNEVKDMRFEQIG